MNFRNISAWCIRNPVPPIVLFIGFLLAGLVAFNGMERWLGGKFTKLIDNGEAHLPDASPAPVPAE